MLPHDLNIKSLPQQLFPLVDMLNKKRKQRSNIISDDLLW